MDERVYSKNIVEFVTVGVEFCGLVEQTSEAQRRDYLHKLVRILPLLYLKATLLPEDEPDEDGDIETYVTEERYEFLREAIARMLGKDDDYLEVFDADMAYSDAPLSASISEGIADIYQDIRDLIEIYRHGNETLSRLAIHRCRENFASYWGQRLVNVMRPLHAICFGADGIDEADEYDEEDDLLHEEHSHHDCGDEHCGHCHE